MEDTIVFIDDGFLARLSKHFGNGKYIKFDKFLFGKNIAKKKNLNLKHLFYYTAPPYQSPKPTEEENKRREHYDRFVERLLNNKEVTVREGRCQRLKIDGKFVYKQKAVDSLVIMDMSFVPSKFPKVKKIILIACDSDFVPVIKNLSETGIKTILATYFDKKRNSRFSTANELMEVVDEYILLKKEDFINSSLN